MRRSAHEASRTHQAAQREGRLEARTAGRHSDDPVATREELGGPGHGVVRSRRPGTLRGRDRRLPEPALVLEELPAVAAAVAQEVAVDLVVVAVEHPAHRAVARAEQRVAAETAVLAQRRRRLEVPLPAVVALEAGVGEDAGRADLHQVAGERAFQHAVAFTPEEDVVVAREDVEVVAAGVVAVEADAAVALDAAVHLVVDQGAEVLAAVGPLGEAVAPVRMARHDRHVLQVALAALVAHRAVVGVVEHQPLDDAGTEVDCVGGRDRDLRHLRHRGHARHHELGPVVVALLLDHLHGALPARPHRAERRVPAEVGQVVAEPEQRLEEVGAVVHLVATPVDHDPGHQASLHGQRCSRTWREKVSPK